MLQDNSKYKAEHDKIIAFVKEQIGIDLNEFRDGNGTSPFTTTYWDLNGTAVCISCNNGSWQSGMSEPIQARLMELVNKTQGMKCEWGGGWFKYIWRD